MSSLNSKAQALAALHVPGRPLVLANVYDTISAEAIAALPNVLALATASYAIAAAAGLEDDKLDLHTNLRAISTVAGVATAHGKPLTADLQDGYGDQLEEALKAVISLGVVGVNLEDVEMSTSRLYSSDQAATRITKALEVAAANGVPDLVVNARVDTLVHGGTIQDAIDRGRAYLAAGATSVFVWGGSARGGLSRMEVELLTRALGGKLNVMVLLAPGNLTVRELASIGVARCSIGPQLALRSKEVLSDLAAGYMAS